MKEETNVISELTNEEMKELFGGEWVEYRTFENGVEITYLIYQ